MSIVNSLVDEVYVVNMDKDTTRMQRIHEILSSRSIEYKRLRATVGKDVVKSKHLTDHCNVYCTDGMKGCALSHRRIWEDMMYHNYKRVLVLEDDVTFDDDIEQQLIKAFDEVPANFDLLYLGCHFLCGHEGVIPSTIVTLLDVKSQEFSENLHKTKGGFGTYGYIITQKCAKQFLNLPINTHIDAQIVEWTKTLDLKSYSIKSLPVKANEESKDSNISESFPTLFNTLVSPIQIGGDTPLDWMLSESMFKIAGHNISWLAILIFVLVLFGPRVITYGLLAWIVIEALAAPKQHSQAIKYFLTIGSAFALRHISANVLFPRVSRFTSTVFRKS